MSSYNIVINPLTPIHIGNGEQLLPYEYVLKNGYIYVLNNVKLYDKLSFELKNKFEVLAEKSLIELRSWILKIYDEAYGYERKIEASQKFKNTYNEKINGAANRNEENSLSINDFCNSFGNTFIPGSSVKGSIRGAYLYHIGNKKEIFDYKICKNNKGIIDYKNSEGFKDKKYERNILQNTNPADDTFRSLKISDAVNDNDIVYVSDINVFTYKKNNNIFQKDIPYFAVCTKSYLEHGEFIDFNMQLSINEKLYRANEAIKVNITLEDIIKALNEKALDMIENEIMFFEKVNYFKTLNVYNKLKEYYNNMDKNKEALIRIGKGAGFDSTTYNLANMSRSNVSNSISRNLVNEKYPLGWAVIKFV